MYEIRKTADFKSVWPHKQYVVHSTTWKLFPNSCTRRWKPFSLCSSKGLLLGVVGSTDIIWISISDSWTVRPLLLWLHTKHFHTALTYLPFLNTKKNSPPCTQNLIIIIIFLDSILKTEKKKKKTRQNAVGPIFLFSQYDIVQHLFINQFSFPALQCFYSFLRQKGSFYFPHDVCGGPNEWRVIFRPSLVFTRTPRCFRGAVGGRV